MPYGNPGEAHVGLLFMCYQSDIGHQFEFIQTNWVNFGGFVKSGTGIDPLIGQTTLPNVQRWSADWDGPEGREEVKFDFSKLVTLRGGEYFFAPSISVLKTLNTLHAELNPRAAVRPGPHH